MALKMGLYIAATPIGNLSDITLRALDTLKNCDQIACEDTRVSRKLLSAYSISKPLISYHDHNADKVRPKIINEIQKGKSVVLISDAGTPLISDPGYKLVQDCYEADLPVTVVPGASSVLAGLILSGMPSDRFLFAGFANKKAYQELSPLGMTLIFFESTKRLTATLEEMARYFPNRHVAVVREITKLFEEVRRGSFRELISHYEEQGNPKGEIVLVLSPPEITETNSDDIDSLLKQTLETHSIRDACSLVSGTLNVPRKQVYARALILTKQK